MPSSFTWVPLYRELAQLLLGWESRQDELIDCLVNLKAAGVKVTPLEDKDQDGATVLLKEIDPFTFLGSFNRTTRDKERLATLDGVRTLLGAKEHLPEDFDGVPLLNNQKSWFIAAQFKRGRDDVKKLWRVFRLAQSESPLDDPEFLLAFDEAMEVWGVSVNLTMGLFWIRPEMFLNLDSVNREFLKIKLPPRGLNAEFYVQTLKTIAQQGKSFLEISHGAWQSAKDPAKSKSKPKSKESTNYWLVGAYWDESEPQDQTQRFLAEGLWQNNYRDKYLDEVRSIRVGDRIAIKSSSTQKRDLPFDAGGRTVSKMTIKAIGTVVANRNDGRTVEVEWETGTAPRDWFFYTALQTIWGLNLASDHQHKEYVDRLIDFVWNGAVQDYEWFCARWWQDKDPPENSDDVVVEPTAEPYGVEDIISSGVFLSESQLNGALDRLRSKKALILQGAPGVGKTFLARKLAYALMKESAQDRLQMVQFHQTYSYEDFIRGYRPLPTQAGTFGLQDAVFHRFCSRAAKDPDRDYVFIIDEINRGNLSQIFGELLMLIEADKRGPEFAVPLVYQRSEEELFFVPANVYLIGLMNLADRSLALVDYALRRRFAFLGLTPQYSSSAFQEWLLNRNMTPELAELISTRMLELNKRIAEDPLLGSNFEVGHSFFCPKGDEFGDLDRSWYESIVETEVLPLLGEYWFDDNEKLRQVKEGLLAK